MDKLKDSVIRDHVWRMTDGRCWYCGEEMIKTYNGSDKNKAGKLFCIDHAKPVSRGGKHTVSNYLPACKRCNCSKNGRTVEEYREAFSKPECEEFTESQVAYLAAYGFEMPKRTNKLFFGEAPLIYLSLGLA